MREIDPQQLENYRIALEAAIARSSLRAVAAAVGMSPTGLALFIEGTLPYGKTVEKVGRWFRQNAGWEAERAEHIAEQLRLIVATLPNPDSGVANLLDAVEGSYRSAGLTAPGWVERVRRRIGAPAAARPAPESGAVVLTQETA
jgi:hypothetical protein